MDDGALDRLSRLLQVLTDGFARAGRGPVTIASYRTCEALRGGEELGAGEGVELGPEAEAIDEAQACLHGRPLRSEVLPSKTRSRPHRRSFEGGPRRARPSGKLEEQCGIAFETLVHPAPDMVGLVVDEPIVVAAATRRPGAPALRPSRPPPRRSRQRDRSAPSSRPKGHCPGHAATRALSRA